jgi:hypothetical protein
MAPLLTASGYCKKDVYESLDTALATRDVARACCLVAELACTPHEARKVLAHLVSVYATWHVNGNAAVVQRLGAVAAALDGRQTFEDPEKRRGLCELTVLVAALPRRADPHFWRGRCCDSSSPSDTTPTTIASFEAALESPSPGSGPGLLLLAERLLDAQQGARDAVWMVWDALRGAAPSEVRPFVRSSFELFSVAYSKRHRERRRNILMYAVLASVRGRVGGKGIPDDVESAVREARQRIDDVYAEIQGPPDECMQLALVEPVTAATSCDMTLHDPRQQHIRYETRRWDSDPQTPWVSPPQPHPWPTYDAAPSTPGPVVAPPQHKPKTHKPKTQEPRAYLTCIDTPFDHRLRCRMADERRSVSASAPHVIKTLSIRDRK